MATDITYAGIAEALMQPDTALRIFGKPEVRGHRRMAVTLARGDTIDEARRKAVHAAACIKALCQLTMPGRCRCHWPLRRISIGWKRIL